MQNRKKLNIRIDADLHDFLCKNAPNTLTSYVESLITQGVITEVSNLYDKAENSYQTAVLAARNEALKAKDAEITALKIQTESVNSQLDTQINLIVGFCIAEGISKRIIEKYAEDVDLKDQATQLKFINRLTVELATKIGYEGEVIRSWGSSYTLSRHTQK